MCGEEVCGEAREPGKARRGGKARQGRKVWRGGKARQRLRRQHGGLPQHGQGHGGQGPDDGVQLLGHAAGHLPDGPQHALHDGPDGPDGPNGPLRDGDTDGLADGLEHATHDRLGRRLPVRPRRQVLARPTEPLHDGGRHALTRRTRHPRDGGLHRALVRYAHRLAERQQARLQP
ncbi:hypothetical protein ACH3WN_25385 [Streptomyces albogriseolus]|uniref:hypothetical protein n=1 Tax=Streptomyces albogriseolus TaxID=1887 RepID=UPI0037B21632